MGDETKRDTRSAVRQVLLASAAVAPAYLFAPEAAAQAPFVYAGQDRRVQNLDDVPGEFVTLEGSATGSSTSGQLTLVWTNAQGQQIASGATPTVRLPTGVNQLTLTATGSGNSSSSSDIVLITVDYVGPLESAAKSPNAKKLGRSMDYTCDRILSQFSGEGVQLPKDQADLRDQCNNVFNSQNSAQQAAALEEWGAQDFNSLRTVTVEFSQTQFQSVMDRLLSLRSGARDISLAGLTINSGGRMIDGEQVAASLKQVLGGGAAAEDSSGLLDNRLGLWMRGNLGDGKKDATAMDAGFQADQWGVTGGVDYRFGRDLVAGVSLGYGKNGVDFNSGNGGGFDSTSVAASLYGSGYLFRNLYVDGVINYIDADYDTSRHMVYNDTFGTVDRTASGETGGNTLSGGFAVGYDLSLGAFTIAPSVGYYYVDSTIDAFREHGASGLDLVIGEQDFKSSTANAGLRLSYAWKTSWAVVVPHIRGQYVREFEDEAEVFNVRFANDPFAGSADASPPIAVTSDTIDETYLRFAAGLSLQMKHGLAAYVDYQRLEGFDNVSFQDYTIGLRCQHSFR